MYLIFISTMEYNCDKLKGERRNKYLGIFQQCLIISNEEAYPTMTL